MAIFYSNNEKSRVGKIINEALSEALSNTTPRSYREIWIDMIGKIISINDPKIVADWESENPQFHNEVGEGADYSFEKFVESVVKIEDSVIKALAAHGNQQTLN